MLEIDPLLETVVISGWLRKPIFSAPSSAEFFSLLFFIFIFFNFSFPMKETFSHALSDSLSSSAFSQIGHWPLSYQAGFCSEFGY